MTIKLNLRRIFIYAISLFVVRFCCGAVIGFFDDLHQKSIAYSILINFLPDSIIVALIFARLGMIQDCKRNFRCGHFICNFWPLRHITACSY